MTDTKASVVRALHLGTLDAKPAGPSSLMWDAEVYKQFALYKTANPPRS